MAELRHSASLGSRATSSPMKRDEDSLPFVSEERRPDDDDDGRHSSKERERGFLSSFAHTTCPYFFTDDSRVPQHFSIVNDASFRISVAFIAFFFVAALISFPSIWNRLNAPYLCTKDGIVLHCPAVKEPPSLWENPYSATTSWKPCAERRSGGISGILPIMPIQMDIYWKEKGADSDWVRANDISDSIEDGYDSSRDEISSISSYNPTKGNIELAFRHSSSLQSATPRLSNAEVPYVHGERSNYTSYITPPKLSVAEVSYDPSGDISSPNQKLSHSASILLPNQQRRDSNSQFTQDDARVSSMPGNVDPVASEGFIRGRSYNIRMDDQVLLRFSPKSSDSTYYFGDMIGGTLTFFQEGARRCLEISVTLETSETINQRYIHPSRRNSTTITKIQSDHYEIVADLLQTSFLFSIPVDGPMSFSTPHITVHWALRFEFFTTPKYVDWRRYEHPLLIDGRDKSEWVLPITVHAPPLRTQSVQSRNEKPLPVGALWIHN